MLSNRTLAFGKLTWGMMMLKVADIETFYGPSQALFGVNLEVNAGEMVALMGRNGMGKTTTIRSIFGLTPASKGSIEFDAQNLRRLPAYRIAKAGLGLVPEGRRCFANLTVRENLMVTARLGEWTLNKVETTLSTPGRTPRTNGQDAFGWRTADVSHWPCINDQPSPSGAR